MSCIRRSPRLAEKALTRLIEEPLTPKPKSKKKSSPRKAPEPLPVYELTWKETVEELILRWNLRTQAREIRTLIELASTKADFLECKKRVNALWNTANRLRTGDCDNFFLTDCGYWCSEAEAGSDEHSQAIHTIGVYISCLTERIWFPPTMTLMPPS